MFELRDLESFMNVVEHKNFARAADALGVTQPTLSRRIAALERSFGTLLFSRQHRQIQLTPAGEIFARESMALLARAESARSALRQASSGSKGMLKIATRSSARYVVIMEAVRHFRAAYPDVSIALSDPLRPLRLEQLYQGEFDVALVRGPVDLRPGLSAELLRADPLVVAFPDGHRFAMEPAIDLRDLAGEAFVEIAYHSGYGSKALVRGACADAGFVPKVVQEVETVDMLVMAVAAGIGLAIMYDASHELPIPGIVYRPLRPQQKLLALYAVWRKADDNPVIAPFVRALKEAARSLDDLVAADERAATRYGT